MPALISTREIRNSPLGFARGPEHSEGQSAIRNVVLLGIVLSSLACSPPPAMPPAIIPQSDPLPIQQAKAYGETITGRFVCLSDFENAPVGPSGLEQVNDFTIQPAAPASSASSIKYVLNITRTGAAAAEVSLEAGQSLVFGRLPVHDFSPYTLVSFALYSPALRDDLVVSLDSQAGSWTSGRILVEPGWNNVLVDIQRLGRLADFNVADVQAMRITFADAMSAVSFNIDDIMLIDNRRQITPTPDGLSLTKNGLDYTIAFAHSQETMVMAQGDDGLWRLGEGQAILQCLSRDEEGQTQPATQTAETRAESLAAMGQRKIGRVEVLEHNSVRLRIANTWYFPTRTGEWASMAVRQVCWEYTFYADGRWLTHVSINNAGGEELSQVRLLMPAAAKAAIWGQGLSTSIGSGQMAQDVIARWSYLATWPIKTEAGQALASYLTPGRLQMRLGDKMPDGSQGSMVEENGFDPSQGCYVAASRFGQCRFTLVPPPAGPAVCDATIRVMGRWNGQVSVNVDGLPVRDVAILQDGSALFVVPGLIQRPSEIEVFGSIAPGSEASGSKTSSPTSGKPTSSR